MNVIFKITGENLNRPIARGINFDEEDFSNRSV